MTKQEKIKEAYGDYWELFHDKLQERALNDDGFIDRADFHDYTDFVDYDYEEEYINEYYSRDKYRPMALKGIENNNGWKVVQNSFDLPKQRGEYFFVSKTQDGKIVKSYYNPNSKEEGNKSHFVKLYSHYQPVQIPKLPIY